MKQSIGTTFLLNFIVIFLIVTFAFLAGIMNYMRAFKVNSGIENAIENHEGYNALAVKDINNFLINFGYRMDSSGVNKCPKTKTHVNKSGKRETGTLMKRPYASSSGQNFKYCIYEFPKNKDNYFTYGVITYIYIDVPIINSYLAIPVYSETERIYEFNVGR